MTPVLEIKDLSKSFTLHDLGRHIDACREVNITLGSGDFVGITGKSGSGKSTILKLIYRSYLPEKGEAWYDSREFGRINLFEASDRQIIFLRRYEIGYVSQFLHVIPRTTARMIIEHASLEQGDSASTAKEQAAEILSHFELPEELWDSYPSTFSGGEKLRLNIARAMVKKPRLLLLDEPTASLDVHSKQRVREVIENLKNGGTTMLGIFHDLEFMDGLCDREHAMSGGAMELSYER